MTLSFQLNIVLLIYSLSITLSRTSSSPTYSLALERHTVLKTPLLKHLHNNQPIMMFLWLCPLCCLCCFVSKLQVSNNGGPSSHAVGAASVAEPRRSGAPMALLRFQWVPGHSLVPWWLCHWTSMGSDHILGWAL